MARSVTLATSDPIIKTIDGDTGYYIKFKILSPIEMTPDLFVFRIVPPSPENPDSSAWSHIASPCDIEEYPIGIASVNYSDSYRLSEVEFLFKSIDLLTKTITEFKNKIADVIAKLNHLDTLVLYEEIDIEV